MPDTFQLSSVPSEALLQALDELEVTERTPGYVVDMGDWHHYEPLEETCHVCLAGVVMRALGVPRTRNSRPWRHNERPMLCALDALRMGLIRKALEDHLAIYIPDGLPEVVEVFSYRKDPAQFKADMRSLAALLKQHGQ